MLKKLLLLLKIQYIVNYILKKMFVDKCSTDQFVKCLIGTLQLEEDLIARESNPGCTRVV